MCHKAEAALAACGEQWAGQNHICLHPLSLVLPLLPQNLWWGRGSLTCTGIDPQNDYSQSITNWHKENHDSGEVWVERDNAFICYGWNTFIFQILQKLMNILLRHLLGPWKGLVQVRDLRALPPLVSLKIKPCCPHFNGIEKEER